MRGRDAARGEAQGQAPEGRISVSRRAPSRVWGPGKQHLAKGCGGNLVLDGVRVRVALCHIKPVVLIVALRGPALLTLYLEGVHYSPRLGCKCTQLLGFWDRLGCDTEHIDVRVLARRHRLPSSAQHKEPCGAVPALAVPCLLPQ